MSRTSTSSNSSLLLTTNSNELHPTTHHLCNYLNNPHSHGSGSCYTLNDIINDCIQDKLRLDLTRGKNTRNKSYYLECWNSLNCWIESRLQKRLGVSIIPLGTFTWEIKDDDNNERLCRPIFIINKQFSKDHNIRQKYFYLPSNLAKCEEVNYTNLAIKYTKILTKDMIFHGIKDIIKKIGDYIDRIYEFEIMFSFGTLYSKERKVRFEFDHQRLIQILPESMSTSLTSKALGYNPQDSTSMMNSTRGSVDQNRNGDHEELFISTTTAANTTSTSRIESKDNYSNSNTLPSITNTIRPSTTQSTSSQSHATTTRLTQTYSAPSLDNSTSSSFSSSYEQSQQQQQQSQQQQPTIPNLNLTFKTIDRSVPPPPLSPGLKSLLLSMNNPTLSHQMKVSNRIQCCDNVAKQAFNRCLYDVENSAIDDDYTEFQRKLLYKEWLDKEKIKKEKFRKELVDIQDTLKQQMNEVNQRKLHEITERKHGKIHFGLPGQIPKIELSKQEIREQKEKMLQGLQKQIITTNNELNLIKKQNKLEESLRLKKLQDEEEIDRLIHKTKQLEKQRDLLEAWERDAHVKNLQKLVNKGSDAVKSYIHHTGLVDNLPDDHEQSNILRGTYRLNDSGIGFDTRKKKLDG